MDLYGSTTSPYVRRVRIIADELGLQYSSVNTAEESGQSQLRKISPLWKVPTLVNDQEIIWDSHTIIDWLFEKYGYGSLRKPTAESKWQEINIICAADAVLDSGINVFYLKKDGVDSAGVNYLEKQILRIAAILDWLTRQLPGPYLKDMAKISYAGIAIVSAIDWLRFRDAYNLSDYQELVEFTGTMNQHKIIGDTMPG